MRQPPRQFCVARLEQLQNFQYAARRAEDENPPVRKLQR
jgi:hypothetical protein